LANVREIAHERPAETSVPWQRHWLAVVLITVVLLAVPFVAALGGQAWVRIANFAILYIFLALGLNIVVGYAGCWTSVTLPFTRSAPTSMLCWHRHTSGCTCHSGSFYRWVPASPVSSGCCSVRRR
jgi:hypothetical protein